jgi:hypothetical protein
MPRWSKILRSKKVQEGVGKKAEKVQAYWQGLAPVFGDKPPHRAAPKYGAPGAYRDSIVVEDRPDGFTPGKRVKDTDFKSRWIEFGSAHMPTYAPAAKTSAHFK